MRIFIESSESKNVILIFADERLDLSAYGTFSEAAWIASNNPLATAIVVDLGRTKQLFDSGKAMLLSLHKMAGRLKNRIYLTNVGPGIKHQLSQGKIPSMFYIKHD